MTDDTKLAPPGAGLPFFEGLYAKYVLFPRGMRKFDWKKSLDKLETETTRIIEYAKPLSVEAFLAPVLIDRIAGIEDSSRHWSVAMTIEHLIITMRGMTQIAEMLAAGKDMNVSVSTANVKPKGGNAVDKEMMLKAFRNACDETVSRLQPWAAKASDKCRVAHPFFGSIPAQGWVWTLGEHQAVHRRQVAAILEKRLNLFKSA